MTLRLDDSGAFVRVPGDDVVLSKLRPDIKAAVWRGMRRLDPERAAAWSTLSQNENYLTILDHFGGSLVLTRAEFERYKAAGRNTNQQQQKELRTC